LSNQMKPTEIGGNRTGIATSPLGFEAFPPGVPSSGNAAGNEREGRTMMPDTTALERMRSSYCQESEPVGTMPAPVKVKGVVKTAVAAVKGQTAPVLLDKIGERLAFERSGVRLYEALLVKLQASHTHDSSITPERIEEIRDDELRHAGMLAAALQQMGADPTAVTPCADVTGVLGGGFVQVLTDAKTTLTQCLNTMLMAELGDYAGWELLIELTEQLGQDDLTAQFRVAAEEESRHEATIRDWVRTSVIGQADEDMDPQTTH
jgi:rubrerythrin